MSTTLHTVNRQIQDLHTRTVNILLKIAINSTVRTIIPLNPDLASYEEFEQYREIDNLIRNYIAEESYIERIVIIRSDGRVFFSGSPIMMREEALELYNTCLQYEGDTFFTVSRNMYCYRPIYTIDDGQGAIVLADLNEETIDSIFQRSSFTNMDIFIMTQNGRLFSQTPSNTINISQHDGNNTGYRTDISLFCIISESFFRFIQNSLYSNRTYHTFNRHLNSYLVFSFATDHKRSPQSENFHAEDKSGKNKGKNKNSKGS